MNTSANIVVTTLTLLGLVTTANHARSEEAIDMFDVVAFARAVNSGSPGTFSVTTGFTSLQACEAARSGVAEDFRQFLEHQRLQSFKIESNCSKDDGED
jgi:hypothetical protein